MVVRHVWGRDMPFMVERTRPDCAHACTVDDLRELLCALPKEHVNNQRGIAGIQGVILRQPTRREQTLHPVWARLGFAVHIGPVTGPALMLEAQPSPLKLSWPRKLSLEGQRELARLQAAASEAHFDGRRHHLRFDLEAVRRVQLFFSLPHELGHWVDMLEKVELPGLEDYEEWERCWERYWQRPRVEREEFANRYAERELARLREAGQLPYPRRLDPEALSEEGLRLEDFTAPEP